MQIVGTTVTILFRAKIKLFEIADLVYGSHVK